jgi:hypothetical protein
MFTGNGAMTVAGGMRKRARLDLDCATGASGLSLSPAITKVTCPGRNFWKMTVIFDKTGFVA